MFLRRGNLEGFIMECLKEKGKYSILNECVKEMILKLGLDRCRVSSVLSVLVQFVIAMFLNVFFVIKSAFGMLPIAFGFGTPLGLFVALTDYTMGKEWSFLATIVGGFLFGTLVMILHYPDLVEDARKYLLTKDGEDYAAGQCITLGIVAGMIDVIALSMMIAGHLV